MCDPLYSTLKFEKQTKNAFPSLKESILIYLLLKSVQYSFWDCGEIYKHKH